MWWWVAVCMNQQWCILDRKKVGPISRACDHGGDRMASLTTSFPAICPPGVYTLYKTRTQINSWAYMRLCVGGGGVGAGTLPRSASCRRGFCQGNLLGLPSSFCHMGPPPGGSVGRGSLSAMPPVLTLHSPLVPSVGWSPDGITFHQGRSGGPQDLELPRWRGGRSRGGRGVGAQKQRGISVSQRHGGRCHHSSALKRQQRENNHRTVITDREKLLQCRAKETHRPQG